MLKFTDPDLAKQYEQELLKKDTIHEILTTEHDLSEVKLYPGSEKGPLPEDDPQAYSTWFVNN